MIKCAVGISIGEACGGARTRLDEDEFELLNIGDLTDDISYYLKQNNHKNTSKCVNVTGTEKWLIEQRLGSSLGSNEMICPKHIMTS